MPALPAAAVDGLIAGGASARMPDAVQPGYKVGDRVLVRNMHTVKHTRLPRYVRGKTGVVVADHGVFCFNDTNAHAEGHKPQHVYNVRFVATDLWGATAGAKDSLHIDLFEDYIERIL